MRLSCSFSSSVKPFLLMFVDGSNIPFLIFGSLDFSLFFVLQYPIHEYFPDKTLKQLFKKCKGLLIKKNRKIQSTIPKKDEIKSKRRFFLLLEFVLIVLMSIVYKSPLVLIELLPMIDNVSSGAIL